MKAPKFAIAGMCTLNSAKYGLEKINTFNPNRKKNTTFTELYHILTASLYRFSTSFFKGSWLIPKLVQLGWFYCLFYTLEKLGGSVVNLGGCLRVQGVLAVSRAIGDSNFIPYISSDPDITTVEMDGTEDFIIAACDGLWDTVTPDVAIKCVFNQLKCLQQSVFQIRILFRKFRD